MEEYKILLLEDMHHTHAYAHTPMRIHARAHTQFSSFLNLVVQVLPKEDQ